MEKHSQNMKDTHTEKSSAIEEIPVNGEWRLMVMSQNVLQFSKHGSKSKRERMNQNWKMVLVFSCPCKQNTTFRNWVVCPIQIFPYSSPSKQ